MCLLTNIHVVLLVPGRRTSEEGGAEEVETKVSAWQMVEVPKINNRFKREEVVIKETE